MKARQLIGNASFGPDQLRVLFEAFDQAWDTIAADVGDDPGAIEVARLKLANILLSLAGQGDNDAAWLKSTALQILTGIGGCQPSRP